MAGTGEGKKEEADYKRLHSFPLIRVRNRRDAASGRPEHHFPTTQRFHFTFVVRLFSLSVKLLSESLVSPWWIWFKATFICFKMASVDRTGGWAGNYAITFKLPRELWRSCILSQYRFTILCLCVLLSQVFLCVLVWNQWRVCVSSAHRHVGGNEGGNHGALCHSLWEVCHQQWSKASFCPQLLYLDWYYTNLDSC